MVRCDGVVRKQSTLPVTGEALPHLAAFSQYGQ
jgi:hypothetical protein